MKLSAYQSAHPDRRGAALMMAFFVLVILIVLLHQISFSTSTSARVQRNEATLRAMAATGDLDLLDGGDLTIQGNGAAQTVIDGGGVDRVFHVCPGGGCTNTVTLTGVTIQNGDTDNGGGIFNAGIAMVVASTVSANSANNGGGIFNDFASTTTVAGSTIRANSASWGGGIYNRATLTVQNGSLIGGTGAGNTAGTGGGGIFNYSGFLTVTGSTVSANSANNGGGILNYLGTITVDGTTVSANTAILDGGGIYNNLGTSIVQNGSIVSANTAGYGSGIFNIPGADTLPLSEAVRRYGKIGIPVLGRALGPLYAMRTRVLGTDFRYDVNHWRFHFSASLDGSRARRLLGYEPKERVSFLE